MKKKMRRVAKERRLWRKTVTTNDTKFQEALQGVIGWKKVGPDLSGLLFTYAEKLFIALANRIQAFANSPRLFVTTFPIPKSWLLMLKEIVDFRRFRKLTLSTFRP